MAVVIVVRRGTPCVVAKEMTVDTGCEQQEAEAS